MYNRTKKYEVRKCHWCDWSGKNMLSSHLEKKHGKTLSEWVAIDLGLDKIPKCPLCGKDLHLNGYEFMETCSKKCSGKLRVLEGTHNMLSENLERDEDGRSVFHQKLIENGTLNLLSENLSRNLDGKSVSHILISKNATESGKKNILSKNLPRDMQGKSISHKRMNENRMKNGNHPWAKDKLDKDFRGKSILHSNNRSGHMGKSAVFYVLIPKYHPLIKIGITSNLDVRLRTFRVCGMSGEFTLIHTTDEMTKKQASVIENSARNHYREFNREPKFMTQVGEQKFGKTEWYLKDIIEDLLRKLNKNYTTNTLVVTD